MYSCPVGPVFSQITTLLILPDKRAARQVVKARTKTSNIAIFCCLEFQRMFVPFRKFYDDLRSVSSSYNEHALNHRAHISLYFSSPTVQAHFEQRAFFGFGLRLFWTTGKEY